MPAVEPNFRSVHIADNPQLYTPARTNNFEFIITGEAINNLLKAGVDYALATEDDYIKNAQDVLRFSLSECPFPDYEINTIEVKTGNLTTKFAGTATFKTGTFKFNDYIGAETEEILEALHAKVVNIKNGGGVAPKEEYAFTGILIKYNTDFSKVLRQWEVKGCWIKDLNRDSYNYESDDKRQIGVTIEYDRAVPVPVD